MLAIFIILPYILTSPHDKRDLAKPKMAIIETNLERFFIDCSRFPTEAEGLEALLNSPPDLVNVWKGPYLKRDNLFDPWGNQYIYKTDSDPNKPDYIIISYGADGVHGGKGYNTDVYNYE